MSRRHVVDLGRNAIGQRITRQFWLDGSRLRWLTVAGGRRTQCGGGSIPINSERARAMLADYAIPLSVLEDHATICPLRD